MSPALLISSIILLPVLVLLLLRVNAALVFLSLCLGDVLVQFIAPDANNVLNLFALHGQNANYGNNTIRLFLLLVPVVLTTLFLVRTVKGKTKAVMNIFPAIGVGLLTALLIVPLLSAGIQHEIVSSSIWTQVQRSQVLIVGMSALVCLFFLWLQRPKSGSNRKK
jgi:Na+(H+)/acetate symporter ActP